MIWKQKTTVEDINKWCKDTLVDHLGIIVTELGSDFVTAIMSVKNNTKQPHGIMHGGASCVLAESIGSIASNICLSNEYKAVGSSIETKHIRPAKSGTVTGIAKPLHIGRRNHIWKIHISDDKDRLISYTILTTTIIRA